MPPGSSTRAITRVRKCPWPRCTSPIPCIARPTSRSSSTVRAAIPRTRSWNGFIATRGKRGWSMAPPRCTTWCSRVSCAMRAAISGAGAEAIGSEEDAALPEPLLRVELGGRLQWLLLHDRNRGHCDPHACRGDLEQPAESLRRIRRGKRAAERLTGRRTGQNDRPEYRDQHGRKQIPAEVHRSYGNAELMARHDVLHGNRGEGRHRTEARSDQDQGELERERGHIVRVPCQVHDSPDCKQQPAHWQELVVPHAAEHLSGETGAGIERDHHDHEA